MNKEKAFILFCSVLTGVGIIICILSIALYFFCKVDIATCFGIISSAISIILGMLSIFYTFLSGRQTIENMDKFERKYEAFSDMVNASLSSKNIDDANYEAVRKMFEKNRNSNNLKR